MGPLRMTCLQPRKPPARAELLLTLTNGMLAAEDSLALNSTDRGVRVSSVCIVSPSLLRGALFLSLASQ